MMPEPFDAFCSPANAHFYKHHSYRKLGPRQSRIRLISIFPRKTLEAHLKDNANWKQAYTDASGGEQGTDGPFGNGKPILACQIEDIRSMARVDGTYYALSYCAGDPTKTSPILLDGLPFNAFANLEYALDSVLSFWRSKNLSTQLLLWTDQICINQSDKSERAAQVREMQHIYRRAKETLVCLPALDPIESDCLSWIPKVPRMEFESSALSRRQDSPILGVFKQALQNFLLGKDLTTELAMDSKVFQTSLQNFVRSPWWRRAWVYQEFVSSSQVQILSGGKSISWWELYPLVDFLCNGIKPFVESFRLSLSSLIPEERRKMELQWQHRCEELKIAIEHAKKEEAEIQKRYTKAVAEGERLYETACADYSRRIVDSEDRIRSKHEAAWETQANQRTEYHRDQLDQLDQLKCQIKNQHHEFSVAWGSQATRFADELKFLEELQREYQKPIRSQIDRAYSFTANGNRTQHSDPKIEGHLYDDKRIQSLLALDTIPPLQRSSSRPSPPSSPSPLSGPSSPGDTYHRIHRMDSLEQLRARKRAQNEDNFVSRKAQNRANFENSLASWKLEIIGTEPNRDDFVQQSISQEFGEEQYRRTTNGLPYLCEERSNQRDRPGRGSVSVQDFYTPSRVEQLLSELKQLSKEPPKPRQLQNQILVIEKLQDHLEMLDISAIASMARDKANFKRSADLKTLLQHSRNCLCSDSRDRVYAYLGLAHPGYKLVPSYEKQIDEELQILKLLADTSKAIIEFDKSLAILSHVFLGRSNLGLKLPTWVPDWTSKEVQVGIEKYIQTVKDLNTANIPVDASKGRPAVVEFREDFTDGECIMDLKVKGTFLDILNEQESGADCLDEADGTHSFLTQNNMRIITPKSARLDDEVWILQGASKPVLLRQEGFDSEDDLKAYGFLGEVLVCDPDTGAFSEVMYGQRMELAHDNTENAHMEDIWII